MEKSLFFLNTKFQASSHLVWLYSLVCVDLVGNPKDRFSHNEAQMFAVLSLLSRCKTHLWSENVLFSLITIKHRCSIPDKTQTYTCSASICSFNSVTEQLTLSQNSSLCYRTAYSVTEQLTLLQNNSLSYRTAHSVTEQLTLLQNSS